MDIARRSVLGGMAGASVLGSTSFPAVGALAGSMSEIDVKGGGKAGAYIALPSQSQSHAVVLIHEWWGLNEQIKSVADEYAAAGYFAVAVDLFGGVVAKTPGEARSLTGGLDGGRARAILTGWRDWVTSHPRGTGKVASMGWCFGGGWSLQASLAAPFDATVIYYGRVNVSAEQLAPLRAPVLGHFATQDRFINREMVQGFQNSATKAGKDVTVHWYEADHAFANPTGGQYDSEDAVLARRRTLEFLKKTLG